jgi:hypothetical protein
MFSEVPGGTVKHALGSTTTTRATRGAITGLSPPRRASHPSVSCSRPCGPITAAITWPDQATLWSTCRVSSYDPAPTSNAAKRALL